MITLKEQAFFDYIRCPTFYDAVYNKKLPYRTRDSFNRLLNKVANSFYLELMNGNVMRLDIIKRKWDAICEENKHYITEKKCLEGLDLLFKFYKWAEDKRIQIIDINTPYKLVFKGKRSIVEIQGELYPIAKINNQVELLITSFESKYPDQAILDLNLKYSLDSYTFYRFYQKEIGIHLHHVGKNEDFFSYRIRDDFNRLRSTVDNIGFSLENNIYYPRESVLCPSCQMKDVCKVWTNI